ncbi:hypothetical protein DVH24_042839 [Malus domestica]|uniref:PPPDE domain-containing protein n=1 Tax=Malus domestica TaxID=3750 RepID=A0A498KPN0_MALDO|nr:hypothetical protein DVH24_042839 [Malus domestica]
MAEVVLHIYDVTNSGSDKTNSTILQINKIFKDGIGLGGIFHSAVQVYGDDEWSFGFCEQGSGVFSCPSGKNPMYTYRESIVLGTTHCSIFKVNQILRELSREWPGYSYDLLSKTAITFVMSYVKGLGCQSFQVGLIVLPMLVMLLWKSQEHGRTAKTEIVSASKVAYRFLVGVTSNAIASPASPENSDTGTPRFQAAWFKNLITTGAKPSSSSDFENKEEDVRQNQQPHEEPPLQQNSRTWQST